MFEFFGERYGAGRGERGLRLAPQRSRPRHAGYALRRLTTIVMDRTGRLVLVCLESCVRGAVLAQLERLPHGLCLATNTEVGRDDRDRLATVNARR
jgi:hypothetical protein